MQSPTWLCLDIETVGRSDAADYLERETVDLDAIKPDGRLKDADKIAADLERKRAEALADAEQKWAATLAKTSLDWNANRIVAIGLQTDEDTEPRVMVCHDEEQEVYALRKLWSLYAGRSRRLVTFNGAGFDVPCLIQRSRFLRVLVPRIDQRKYGNSDQIDLYRELTFDDSQRTYVIRRTLDNFCRLFRLDVPADPHDGSDIARLVADGAWDDIAHHVRTDVIKTQALAQRLGYISGPQVAEQGAA